MERRLREDPPEQGQPFTDVLAQVAKDVVPFGMRADHPRNLAYVPSSGTWPGALADFIASAANLNPIFWRFSPGASEAEALVLDWFKEWIGYPTDAGGVLTSGGSSANMTALACARESLVGAMSDRLVVYCADQAHSSVARAARILGFRPDQVRVLPADEHYRMRPEALSAAMDADTRAGREPLFVAAAAGSTSTGSIDPLPQIAAICRERGVWFHVDGAYGGFAAITERGRAALAGIELADSVTLDPHKWLYQPFECGCLLVRNGRHLLDAFEIHPDYLRDAKSAVPREVNFADYGMQLSRTSTRSRCGSRSSTSGSPRSAPRSTPLSRSHVVGAGADRTEPDARSSMSPASLGVLCFRRRFGADADEEQSERNAQFASPCEASHGP